MISGPILRIQCGAAEQAMAYAAMALRHRDYLLVPVSSRNAAFDPGQAVSSLPLAVREHRVDRLREGAADFDLPAHVALAARGLATAQVADVPLAAHDLARAGDVEAALGALMSLQLWQSAAPLPPRQAGGPRAAVSVA